MHRNPSRIQAELSIKERQVLEHIKCHRITTLAVVHALFFAGEPIESARNLLRHLDRRLGLIRTRPLFGKYVHYQATPRGARMLGEPEEVAEALGPQALPRVYGVLAFCCLGETLHKRLTRDEFRKHFATLRLPFNDYCIDASTNDHVRLVRVITDLGGDSSRIVRKLQAIMHKMSESPKALSFLTEEAFRFSVVTTSSFKEKAIHDAAERICPTLPLEIVVRPELLNLLPGFL